MSLSCALWATSLHQWARRYIRVTQPARCSPEKRARIRAFFANGVEDMHIPWAVEGLPTLLHLSLFLFFGGLVIFLFNVHREVFLCVVSWIGLFSMVYGLVTLLPLIRQDSPYYTPLSILAWFSYASIRHITSKVLLYVDYYDGFETWMRLHDMRNRYRGWMSGGVEKKGEEMVEELSPKIDVGILDWTISALGDDDSVEKFIEAIPGFFNSKLVKDLRKHIPDDVWRRLLDAMNGFLGRTLSSNLVMDSVKLHRLDMSLSAIDSTRASGVSAILRNIMFDHWDQVPKTVEISHTLARWCTSNDQSTARFAHGTVAKVLWTVPEHDDRWVELAARVYGLPERDLRDILTHGDDSVSLSILIQVTRKAFRSNLLWDVLGAFSQIDIRNTLSGLQHDFCTLWNEIVQEAKKRKAYSTPIYILREIRHHYIALHQGTDAAPTLFNTSTGPLDRIMFYPSSYPFCDITSHRPDYVPLPPTRHAHSPNASPHHFISGGSTASRRVKEASIIIRAPSPSHPTTIIEDSSQAPAATSPALPDHTGPRPTDVSIPGAVAAALQHIPLASTLSHPLEGTMQRDIVTPCTEPDITQNLSTASLPAPTPTLAPVPAFTPAILNKSLESCDADTSSTSYFFLPASSMVGFSIPASPPPSRVPPLPSAESLAFLSTTIPCRSTGNVMLPRLRARGLVNTGSICFSNAVLQLLVHSPPFWELFIGLGDLKGLRGAGVPETGSVATPLVDATLRFFGEFIFKEEPPPPQEPPQQLAGGNVREDEETKKEINTKDFFEPMYVYHAMKEKRRLKDLLVRSHATYRPTVTDLCWPNVFRRANSRMRKSFSVFTSTRLMKNCSRYSLLLVVTSRPLLHPKKNSGRLSQARLTWENGASWCANYFTSLR